ncbi:dTMP kinase, partial [bacterium]|nr:dTMP kinase [bacterium]
TELFLYLASRAEHVARIILPAIESGSVVISDRYADASVAYQGGGRELGADLVRSLNEIATRGVKPSVTFLLDLNPKEGLSRLDGRTVGGTRDRIERETIEFHQRVREAYLAEAAREPERFVVVDAQGDVDSIAGEIASVLLRRLTDQVGDN